MLPEAPYFILKTLTELGEHLWHTGKGGHGFRRAGGLLGETDQQTISIRQGL